MKIKQRKCVYIHTFDPSLIAGMQSAAGDPEGDAAADPRGGQAREGAAGPAGVCGHEGGAAAHGGDGAHPEILLQK